MADDGESAIVVELPELDGVLDDHRLVLDPSRRWGMPAHLTVLYPFVRPGNLDDAIIAGLVAAATSLSPFEAEFDDFGWFGDRVEVTWIACEQLWTRFARSFHSLRRSHRSA